MSDELELKTDASQPVVYQIRLGGHLGPQWKEWFGGMVITSEEDGDTLLTGPIIDQAALHGLLKKVRDLGMPLVSVGQVQVNETHSYRSKKGEKMNTTKASPNGTNRKTAISVGVLFIIGTVAGILSMVVTGGILGAPDLLNMVASNLSQVALGALLVLVMGISLAMVPVLMFPIFKRQNETLAIGYVVFRGALETFTTIALVICWLLLVVVARQYAESGPAVASQLSTLGILLVKAQDPMIAVADIVFGIGALMFYYLLYQGRLIPRWISGWGIVAAVAFVSAGLIAMFGTTLDILLMPMLLQEMVMAVWMIVKGFNPAASASESAKPVVIGGTLLSR